MPASLLEKKTTTFVSVIINVFKTMLLDFKEIPQANKGGGLQDTFELFTRDFLEYLGYKIIEHPDRGADGKRDLIVEETMSGIHSTKTLRWLVSCKHHAHSGKSVNDEDEINITDRLKQHSCGGFMGVYSTIPSTSLSGILKKQEYSIIFDKELIEGKLLSSKLGTEIAARYFPESYKKYIVENPLPAQIFSDKPVVECEVCGQNLLDKDVAGIYILLFKNSPNSGRFYEDIVFACKGPCDHNISEKYRQLGYLDSWEDLNDLCIPTFWLTRLMAFMNGIQKEKDLSDEAFEKVKKMFLSTFPYIARHLTTSEKDRIKSLNMYGLLY